MVLSMYLETANGKITQKRCFPLCSLARRIQCGKTDWSKRLSSSLTNHHRSTHVFFAYFIFNAMSFSMFLQTKLVTKETDGKYNYTKELTETLCKCYLCCNLVKVQIQCPKIDKFLLVISIINVFSRINFL